MRSSGPSSWWRGHQLPPQDSVLLRTTKGRTDFPSGQDRSPSEPRSSPSAISTRMGFPQVSAPSEQSSLQDRSSRSCLLHPKGILFRTQAPQDQQRPTGLPPARPGFLSRAPQSRGAGAAAPAALAPLCREPEAPASPPAAPPALPALGVWF